MANYQIEVLHDSQLIRITMTGTINNDLARTIGENVRVSLKFHHYGRLYDIRKAHMALNEAEMFFLVRQFADAVSRRAKSAVLVAKREEEIRKLQFFETTAQKCGLVLKTFVDETEALAWLATP